MRVYFDDKGRIKEAITTPIYATEHKETTIEAYADFDTNGYDVSITLARADGVVLGPYPMVPALDGDMTYHAYRFTGDDTKVPGALKLTIRYELYQYDPTLDELVPAYTKVMAMITTNVYDSVKNADSTLVVMERRIKDLENRLNSIDISDLDEITISYEEPTGKLEGHLWGKILN